MAERGPVYRLLERLGGVRGSLPDPPAWLSDEGWPRREARLIVRDVFEAGNARRPEDTRRAEGVR